MFGLAYSQSRYCDMPCTGNPLEICGGGCANSVYQVSIGSKKFMPNPALGWKSFESESNKKIKTWNGHEKNLLEIWKQIKTFKKFYS